MTPDTLTDQVIAFIAEEAGLAPKRVGLSTRLGEDLGLDGADGTDLMQEFSLRFAVDLGAFDADLFFGPETVDLIGFAAQLLGLRPRIYLRPLPVSDLVDAARRGSWGPQAGT